MKRKRSPRSKPRHHNHDVDLHALRGELLAARMPADAKTLLLNGFIHARNFFRSALEFGDDYWRPLLMKRLSTKQRAKLIREVDENADAIHSWLDSFGQGLMPTEAAAFMYLTLGVEEIRD